MKSLAIVFALLASVAAAQTFPPDGSSGGLPPIQKVTVIIEPAEITTLFTVPVEIVPGLPNTIVLPTHIHIRKAAGTAWTTTGSGVLRLQYSGGTGTHFAQFNQATTDLFFGAGEDVWIAEAGKGSFSGLGDTDSANAIDGAATILSLATADISGGTGNLTVQVWYRRWPGLTP